ncbi:MAG TPA: hypothetical protein DD662_08960 [Planctomycetaceae bacterium]|nr:hypothetical protein [Planctomycetaceae bacterium]
MLENTIAMLVNASFVAHYIRAKTKQVAPSVNNLATNPRFAPSQAIKTVASLVGLKIACSTAR